MPEAFVTIPCIDIPTVTRETRLALFRLVLLQRLAVPLRATLFSLPFLLVGFVSFSQFVGRTGSIFVLVPLIGDQTMHLTSSQISWAIFLVNALNFAQLEVLVRDGPFHEWLGVRLAALDEALRARDGKVGNGDVFVRVTVVRRCADLSANAATE